MAARGNVNHELSKLFNQLWDADVNRMSPGKDYRISLQGKAGYVPAGSNQARDSARCPLFQFVDEEKLKSIKTFAAFISLLDNYEMSTGVAEVVTAEEKAEMNRFLDAILETKVMKIAHEYLVRKNQAKPNLKDFKSQLYNIWFQLYNREAGKGPDSCGFEHVFVGESKRGQEIMGLHNWVQFYLQEKRNNIDYKGFVARQYKSRVWNCEQKEEKKAPDQFLCGAGYIDDIFFFY
ncbi:poly(U)-specific endoribonuclease-A-like isoform X2 [Rhinoderma darwinii]|uniref:poly(U)-specific endoribonuclease-A-like isoform X2 n=1 Tax=Rhinoderma darwinii TaxID=43563 RepID=UPI003F669F0A